MSFAVTDLCDRFPDDDDTVRVCAPVFRDFGGVDAFHGPIATVRTHDDNSRVRGFVEQPGHGRVLVVDGAGSLHRALFGGNLAKLAERNGWAGLVIHGCVRDTAELAAARVGIKALAAHPRRSRKGGGGEIEVPVSFAGVVFHPGEWLYADRDGILVTAHALPAAV